MGEESNRRSDPQNDIPSHGESYPLYAFTMSISDTNYRLKLSKEDESSNSEENEVRREDQEKINRFSSLHQRELVLEQLLKGKQVYIYPFFFLFVVVVVVCQSQHYMGAYVISTDE